MEKYKMLYFDDRNGGNLESFYQKIFLTIAKFTCTINVQCQKSKPKASLPKPNFGSIAEKMTIFGRTS